ncbi:MAG: hypothetical protein ACP5D7_04625 [Limnospira sp.]
MDELTPIFNEFTKEPIAFFGGFVSSVLRLNLSEDPVKTWLDRETGTTSTYPGDRDNNGNGGPQSIAIE